MPIIVSGSGGTTTYSSTGSYTSGSGGGETTYTVSGSGYTTYSYSGSYTSGSSGSVDIGPGFMVVSASSPAITIVAGELVVSGSSYLGSAPAHKLVVPIGSTIGPSGASNLLNLQSGHFAVSGTMSGSQDLHVGATILCKGPISSSATLESRDGVITAGNIMTEAGNLWVSGSSYLGDANGHQTLVTGTLEVRGTSLLGALVVTGSSVGIGTLTPLYDLHVNGAGATVATIDGGASSDAYLKMATNGTEKAFLKLGSGGNLILAQDAAGGDLQLKAKPGGVSTTYLTLDGGANTLTASVDTYVLGALHQSGSNYRKYINKDINYVLTNTDSIVYIGHATNSLTASLPNASTVGGIVYTIKNSNVAPLVIKADGAQLIDGQGSITGSIGQSWTLAANGDVWMVLSSHLLPPE